MVRGVALLYPELIPSPEDTGMGRSGDQKLKLEYGTNPKIQDMLCLLLVCSLQQRGCYFPSDALRPTSVRSATLPADSQVSRFHLLPRRFGDRD
jgi:hypothetical protein